VGVQSLSPPQTLADPVAHRAALAGAGCWVLAMTLIGLGVRGLGTGELASVWQGIPFEPQWGSPWLAYGCALVELAAGIGMLSRSLAVAARRVLVGFLVLWVVLLKLPLVLTMPWREGVWLGFGEILVMVTGAWVLSAASAGEGSSALLRFVSGAQGLRNARILFALALLPIGLGHFVYVKETAALVPAWLPWHEAWAHLTGLGSLAACVAILSGVLARLAAVLETGMLAIITLLCWTPVLAPVPEGAGLKYQLTAFLISAAITAGAWVVADSYRGTRWLAIKWG
jgi:uncharacterized membrane protein YphA (DoxX/SURF4 family)